MALLPLRLPGYPSAEGDGVSEQVMFELVRIGLGSPEVSGAFGGADLGFPLWQWVINCGPMSDDTARLWRGFTRQLRGQQRTAYVRDLLRPYPMTYPGGFGGLNRAGGGAFPSNGAATSWAASDDADLGVRARLTLNGLPAGFVLRMDDQVGFIWQTGGVDRCEVVTLAEDVTASGAGVASNFKIEPPLPSVVPGGAVAYLEKPYVLAKRIVGDGEVGLGSQDTVGMGTFTLTFLQERLP